MWELLHAEPMLLLKLLGLMGLRVSSRFVLFIDSRFESEGSILEYFVCFDVFFVEDYSWLLVVS